MTALSGNVLESLSQAYLGMFSILKFTVKACAFKPNLLMAEAGWSLWVRSQPGLQVEFQSSEGYTVNSCLKNVSTEIQYIRTVGSFIKGRDD